MASLQLNAQNINGLYKVYDTKNSREESIDDIIQD